MSNINSLGILEQRRIEAEIIKPIYETLKKELGIEHAKLIIEKAISKTAIETGKKMAKETDGATNLETYKSILPLWLKNDALEIDVKEDSPYDFNYNVTRCKYAECYKSLGLQDIGYLLSCNRDGKFIEGYAPKVEFKRTQTIMEGASFCDFKFHLNSDH